MQSITSLQQRRVSVTEESVAIRESMVIHGPPVAPEKCRDQKDQGAFRLVEIGDKHIHETETEARNNYDSCAHLQFFERICFKIGNDGSDSLLRRIFIGS